METDELVKVGEEAEEAETLVEADAPLLKKELEKPSAVSLFRHPDAHPYVLDLLLLRTYGPEWFEWEAETIAVMVYKDFRSSISHVNKHKLEAVRTLHFVDSFWTNWEVFVPCVMALNSILPDFEMMQVPTVAQCLIAVDTANRIRSEVSWSEEMKAFLETVHRFDGVLCPIEPLDFLNFSIEGVGYDCAEVKRLWPGVRKSRQAPTEETANAEQLRRLLQVHDALEESRAALTAQLGMLRNA